MLPPERIDNDLTQGRLRLVWADAMISLDHAALRQVCRCAECQFNRHHGSPISAPNDVRITAIQSAGYGAQFVFSDGHARGIFPWAYLAELAATTQTSKPMRTARAADVTSR